MSVGAGVSVDVTVVVDPLLFAALLNALLILPHATKARKIMSAIPHGLLYHAFFFGGVDSGIIGGCCCGYPCGNC